MSLVQKVINIGTEPNDGTGDTLRDSFEKVNENFTDIFSQFSKTRENISFVTPEIPVSEVANVDVEAYKGYVLYQISTSAAAWVRLYVSNTARAADASRLQGDEPAPNSGIIAEITTSSAGSVIMAPGVFGFNNEFPATNIIPVAVGNLGNISTSITVLFTAIEIEN